MTQHNDSNEIDPSAIAIIGMSGRFPGANSVNELWQKLCDGEELIQFFSDEELTKAGVPPSVLSDPNYVKASPTLEGLDKFDAYFFDYSAKEALYMDPQQRVFLESAWEALEHSGYHSSGCDHTIGVYGGSTLSIYLLNNIIHDKRVYSGHLTNSEEAMVFGGNVPEALTTRVAYKLNLTGPAVHFSTACSTSLVAIHSACQSLLNGECDMALAGGVSYLGSQNRGYLYEDGLVLSPDGHCRSFDAEAKGTLWGNGVGVVVLKLLEDALEDGDYIHAIIKGSAINNDGNLKVSHSAPSVDAQARAIYQAQEIAEVEPESIGYIEAHGTATPLGDPIEISALTQAFRSKTDKVGYCALGSLKSNMGHLSEAAGVAGLIKTVLMLKNKKIPPSLNYTSPNPQIDFDNSPFYVNTELKDWVCDEYPRRAGVSSFGVGGTNAHIVLEEWQHQAKAGPGNRPQQLLLLSAKTPTALEAMTANLADHFRQNPNLSMKDVAYTLSVGRKTFEHKRIAVVPNQPVLACETLSPLDKQLVFTGSHSGNVSSIAFMFSGQGSQYVNMTEELYRTEPYFQQQIDHCCLLAAPFMDVDLKSILYPDHEAREAATATLLQTSVTQPALFVVEYALAQLWMSWGVKPKALIGHSVGEYVAATVAGVLPLEDALRLVCARGRLMQSVPRGAMLAVTLSEPELLIVLQGTSLEIAAVNGHKNCVVSGSLEDIETLTGELVELDVQTQLLHTSHAFHSSMMEPILDEFTRQFDGVELKAPEIPYVSNVTGTWITDSDATNPSYYAKQLRSCVRFDAGLKQLFSEPNQILLEVGPGRTLSSFAMRHPHKPDNTVTLTSTPAPGQAFSGAAHVLRSLGQLWLNGVEVDWASYFDEQRCTRLPLPTYPFERHRYWIDAHPVMESDASGVPVKTEIENWLYEASWQRSSLAGPRNEDLEGPILVFAQEQDYCSQLLRQLVSQIQHGEIIVVMRGSEFKAENDNLYHINPAEQSDYHRLLSCLREIEMEPRVVIHLWNVSDHESNNSDSRFVKESLETGFYSLIYLTQAMASGNTSHQRDIVVVSSDMQNVLGVEDLTPVKATLLGPVRVIPREHEDIRCRSVDVEGQATEPAKLVERIIAELQHQTQDSVIALRGNTRWVEDYTPQKSAYSTEAGLELPFRERGTYLITGGLGGMGFVFAEYLAQTVQAKLVLTGRTALPERGAWEGWLGTHAEDDPTSIKIKKIMHMERLGAEVLICAAEAHDAGAMSTVVVSAQERFGEINGVIHAAGVAGGGVIQLKTQETAQAVLKSKVDGTLVLDALFREESLDFMVLCSSLESVFGSAGQVDYCAANSFIDAYAQSQQQRSDRITLSINWDAWQQVGMAVDTERYGFNNQVQEIKTLEHPIFDKCVVEKEKVTFIAKLIPDQHWIVGEHIVLNTPSLVGTAYLEIARSAYECHSGHSTMELQEVYFLKFLFVEKHEEKIVHTILTPNGAAFDFSIQSLDDESGVWSVHAQGKIVPKQDSELVSYDIGQLEASCTENIAVPDLQALPDYTRYGSRWLNNIQWRKANESHNLALMELPHQFASDVESYKFHPSLVDTATYVVADVLPNELTTQFDFFTESSAYLPYFYEKVEIKGPLPARFYSYTSRELQGRDWSINLSFLDSDGTELVSINNYLLKFIDSAYTLKDDQKLKETEQLHQGKVDQALQNGIMPQEGIHCLERALVSGLPQIAVSTSDLRARRRALNAGSSRKDESDILFERPTLSQDYAAPVTECQKGIAKIWENVLGVKDIGIHDNFFELGGDSLIIVQILQQLRKTFSEDLSINDLLNANTVAELAQLIDTSVENEPTVPSCLVRFRSGASGYAPLFLVHPIAGNTHNFVNLPKVLSSKQPIYAFQHPKWIDATKSFSTLEELASYYLQALKQVQPHGPYNLSGYSGGVYVAYEMAQQLTQQGETVGFLGLIDKPHWSSEQDKPKWDSPEFGTPLETMVYFADLRTPRSDGDSHLATYLELGDFDQQLKYFIDLSPWIRDMLPADASFEDWKQFWSVFVELRALNVKYAPQTYHGPTVYFIAEERDVYTPNFNEEAWFQFVPEMKIVEIPGDHVTIWHSPNISALGHNLQLHLCKPKVGRTATQSDLTKDYLLDSAYEKTGLTDFGDTRFISGLDQLLYSINKEANLHRVGTNLVKQLLTRLLVNRLEMQRDFNRYPEILGTNINEPLFVMGLPRTGSTYLHNLLSQDPDSRFLRLWEAFSPSPPPDVRLLDSDPRIAKAEKSFEAYDLLNPESTAMHKYSADAPEECLWLLQHDFSCISFSFLMRIPSYTEWLKTQDMVPVYDYYRQQLKLLSWKWPSKRWVLKNPFHAGDLSDLTAVFSDANLIQTHRDPIQVTASYSRLIEKLRPSYSDSVNKHSIGLEVLDMLSWQMEQSEKCLSKLDDKRVFHMSFQSLVTDPIGTVQNIYDQFGYDLTEHLVCRLDRYVTDNPRYKHGKYVYTLEEYGLDAEKIRARFNDYLKVRGGK